MAGSPDWKVYQGREYIAACKHPEDAAALVAMCDGRVVKFGHGKIVWREGAEAFTAGNSYDEAAAVMVERVRADRREQLRRNAERDQRYRDEMARRRAQGGEA